MIKEIPGLVKEIGTNGHYLEVQQPIKGLRRLCEEELTTAGINFINDPDIAGMIFGIPKKISFCARPEIVSNDKGRKNEFNPPDPRNFKVVIEEIEHEGQTRKALFFALGNNPKTSFWIAVCVEGEKKFAKVYSAGFMDVRYVSGGVNPGLDPKIPTEQEVKHWSEISKKIIEKSSKNRLGQLPVDILASS
jgi:hypothetical protein